MLGKLLRYEIKSTARLFLPLYAALAVLGLLNRLFLSISRLPAASFVLSLPAATGTAIYALTVMAAFVMTFVVMIQRFYKSLLGDEGYLMFTLPVSPAQHLVAKLTVSCLWIFASMAVTAVSLLIMLANGQFFNSLSAGLASALQHLMQFDPNAVTWAALGAEFVALAILGTLSSILMIYFSISLGQLSNRYKLLTAVGAYLGVNAVLQALSTLLTLPMAFPAVADAIESFFSAYPIASLHVAAGAGLLGALLLCAAFFLGTNYLLSKKLNLE
ncbi:MAG: hypothetical protein PHO66_01235 [Eubacteriales bacterium]|nr:hypothetical protein [Eubacteriales bacterium]